MKYRDALSMSRQLPGCCSSPEERLLRYKYEKRTEEFKAQDKKDKEEKQEIVQEIEAEQPRAAEAPPAAAKSPRRRRLR